jgi:RecA-family ATPase
LIRVCDAHPEDGRPNGFGEVFHYKDALELDEELPGNFIAVNPIDGGIADSSVTDYRHCLVEFDDEPLDKQWALIEQSLLPVSVVIYSGGKSLHAWVKVNAETREQYDRRVELVYECFSNYELDTKNKNPSRLSRLPGAERGDRTQDLLAVNIGLPSWDNWLEHMEGLSVGPTIKLSELRGFLDEGDATSLLGNRWLCSGSSCIISGPSGIGKSSLAMQMAMLWGVGRRAFGIKPVRPLKSLIIQAENDKGDLSEQVTGVEAGLGLDPTNPLLEDNVSIIHCTAYAGGGFLAAVNQLLDKHKPDLCWIDPLFSYIGGDVCSQEVCSKFLRQGLNPISARTGVTWMIIHHTTKPREQEYAGSWQSYDMFGSAELVNWARAVCVLKPRAGNFCLILAKRGKRAAGGVEEIMLRHSGDSVCWEEIEDDVIYCD